MKKFILICVVFSVCMTSLEAYSFGKVDKKLEMKKNYSHLITFDEKIIRYRVGEKTAFEIEVLPDIFSNRHEMLVKPLEKTNTNLLVWTETCIYNFDIEAKQKGDGFFFNFSNKKKEMILGEYELDMPPMPSENVKIMDIEIDLPPGIN